jgi:hypothetical protein
MTLWKNSRSSEVVVTVSVVEIHFGGPISLVWSPPNNPTQRFCDRKAVNLDLIFVAVQNSRQNCLFGQIQTPGYVANPFTHSMQSSFDCRSTIQMHRCNSLHVIRDITYPGSIQYCTNPTNRHSLPMMIHACRARLHQELPLRLPSGAHVKDV